MTLIEILLSTAVVGMVVLQCVILMELREQRFARRLRESKRRQWIREEHQ